MNKAGTKQAGKFDPFGFESHEHSFVSDPEGGKPGHWRQINPSEVSEIVWRRLVRRKDSRFSLNDLVKVQKHIENKSRSGGIKYDISFYDLSYALNRLIIERQLTLCFHGLDKGFYICWEKFCSKPTSFSSTRKYLASMQHTATFPCGRKNDGCSHGEMISQNILKELMLMELSDGMYGMYVDLNEFLVIKERLEQKETKKKGGTVEEKSRSIDIHQMGAAVSEMIVSGRLALCLCSGEICPLKKAKSDPVICLNMGCPLFHDLKNDCASLKTQKTGTED